MGLAQRITRRALLRLSGRMMIGTTVSTLFLTPRTAHADPDARTFTWEQRDIALADSPVASPTLTCDFAFNAVEARWDADLPPGATLDFFLRTSSDGGTWDEWIHLHTDDHARDGDDQGPTGDLIIVAPATQLQYRIEASAGDDLPVLRSFALTAINTIDDSLSPVTAQAATPTTLTIIPRAGWGADERLRFDKKQQEIWPPEYRPIEKVVIHHTVTNDPDPNPTATIRAIYQYHAIGRGWGDIGYNFLVDPNGHVYEGRHGGAGVVGGHTYGYNYGSMGVAMLGTYSGHSVSSAARGALKALINAKAGHLDPLGKGFFINRDNVWNISGHRSLTQTDCPGDRFYLSFDNLRRELKGLPQWTGDPHADPLAANPPDASAVPPQAATKKRPTPATTPETAVAPATPAPTVRAAIGAVSWPTASVYSRDLVPLRLTIKNTGTATLPAGKPAPTFVYTEGKSYVAEGVSITRGTFDIALGPAEKPNDPPYRWGLDRDIRPGEMATVSVSIRLRTPQRAGLVVWLRREGYAILDQSDPLTLTVLANPTDPVPADTGKNNLYVPETKHNVAGAIGSYWEANGGRALFGLPISEAFNEKNTDDSMTYLTQYFERARLEVHPGRNGAADRIELGRLGSIVAQGREKEHPFLPVARVTETADRRFFADVGHTLSGVFKTYWDAHGGLAVFGLPISEPFDEKSATDGKTYQVQYFERNRFEHHPENAGHDGEVALGLLGSEILRKRGWLE
jgi:hypothetical protein